VGIGFLGAAEAAMASPETPTATAAPAPPPAASATAVGPAPLGFIGGEQERVDPSKDFVPVPDRWRIGFPDWQRYDGYTGEPTYGRGSILDPYSQNMLKADYPIIGDDIFLDLTLRSDTLVEGRSFPLPSGVSTERRRGERFFGDFNQFFFVENFLVSMELFKGDTAFRPKDWAIKFTPVLNVNFIDFQEVGLRDIDVREGDDRLDAHVGIQELFVEYHIADLSPNYDFLTTILGIQSFTSDFRGFLYSDQNLGARLQSNFGSNRYQANLAWFHQLDKDTNSGLNELETRKQNVFIANFFAQDFLTEGYTALLSWHYNSDHGDREFDDNGFLVRPARIGAAAGALGGFSPKDIDVHYLGWGGDGHIGSFNLTHQYYFAFGSERRNEISNKNQRVFAHFAALEPSVDVDWLRVKGNFMYASGDKDPLDGVGAGFDSIIDNPFFAGSGFSYFNRQNIPFVQTGVNLVQRLSLLPSLRTSKFEGQSNFVNPGLWLAGGGLSGKITPKLFFDLNVNCLWFAETESLELLQQQRDIEHSLGLDYSLGIQYRPLLTENIILTVAGSGLTPWEGFEAIYRGSTLYSSFFALTLTY
jgi:hypothetical protein